MASLFVHRFSSMGSCSCMAAAAAAAGSRRLPKRLFWRRQLQSFSTSATANTQQYNNNNNSNNNNNNSAIYTRTSPIHFSCFDQTMRQSHHHQQQRRAFFFSSLKHQQQDKKAGAAEDDPSEATAAAAASDGKAAPVVSKAEITDDEQLLQESEREVIFESPFSGVITRLRLISFATGIFGSIGCPTLIYMKSTNIPRIAQHGDPYQETAQTASAVMDAAAAAAGVPTGVAAVAMMCVSLSLLSTVGVYYIFSPYVFKIERIPIRLCLYKKKKQEAAAAAAAGTTGEPTENDTPTTTPSSSKSKIDWSKTPSLYVATTKNLFLMREEVVFDPKLDGELERNTKGLRPIVNVSIKGKPYYFHFELINSDELLAKRLQLEPAIVREPRSENPDDFL